MALTDQERDGRRNTVDAIDLQQSTVIEINGEPFAVPHVVTDWFLAATGAGRTL